MTIFLEIWSSLRTSFYQKSSREELRRHIQTTTSQESGFIILKLKLPKIISTIQLKFFLICYSHIIYIENGYFQNSESAQTISYRPNCQITRLVHISPLTKMIPLILENFNFVLKKLVKNYL